MGNRRAVHATLLVCAVAGLACSGVVPRGVGPIPSVPDDVVVDSTPVAPPEGDSDVRGQYMVKLAPVVRAFKLDQGRVATGNALLDRALRKLKIKKATQLYGDNPPQDAPLAGALGLGRTIHIHTATPALQVISALEEHADVEWVEPVRRFHRAQDAGGPPNDPYWRYQWNLAALDVTAAWAMSRGRGTVVAVIDTGVSQNADGLNALMPGIDFVDGDDQPLDPTGHGTHVAGTIAQSSANGVGVASVAPLATILPVRVLDEQGMGSTSEVARGIVWAVDHGADVINLSLSSRRSSEVVADACAYAFEHGVTVVAATGNDGNTDVIGFPAALPTTIAVGATNINDEAAPYTNQGDQIDLVAPGGDTTADDNRDGLGDGVLQESAVDSAWAYHAMQGTSVAAAHVSGVAALIHAAGQTDPGAIRILLSDTARDLGRSGWDPTFGAGLVDPAAALAAVGEATRQADLIAWHRVVRLSSSRASIDWVTTEPTETFVRGSNGFKLHDTTHTTTHRVAVHARPGEKVKFTFGSRVGPRHDRDEITVQF